MDQKLDLILIDVDLPDRSGFALCRRLKVDPGLAAIPVLLLSTAFGQARERLQALAAGADEWVIESMQPAEFLKQIRALRLVQEKRMLESGNSA